MRRISRVLSFIVLSCAVQAIPLHALAQAPELRRSAPPPPVGATSAQVSTEAPAPVKIKPVRDLALYQTEVTLTSQNASERQGATARALLQVLIKLTGDLQAPNNALIRRSLPSASSFVSEASAPVTASDSEGNTAVGGVPVYKTTLAVNFDPEAVDALIAGAGLKYWTGNRPKPMLWLAIDDGRGPRLVSSQQLGVVKPLAVRGLERGLHFLLPAGSAIEQSAITAIDAQNIAALQVLSARYGDDTQLIGKVARIMTGGWTADWLLTQAGVELARWSFSDADARRTIASGADPAADAIASRDAVFLDTGPAGLYLIDVAGVDSQAEFLRLMGYLQTLPIVRRITVIKATPASLRLQLDLNLGLKGFTTMVETGNTLRSLSNLEQPQSTSELMPSTDSVPRFGLK